MNTKGIRRVVATTAGLTLLLVGGAETASAGTPTGACTNSYQAYNAEQLAFDPAAQAIFSVIDRNGDGLVCFKPYPNGAHAGHDGNLVDDKAAPHA